MKLADIQHTVQHSIQHRRCQYIDDLIERTKRVELRGNVQPRDSYLLEEIRVCLEELK